MVLGHDLVEADRTCVHGGHSRARRYALLHAWSCAAITSESDGLRNPTAMRAERALASSAAAKLKFSSETFTGFRRKRRLRLRTRTRVVMSHSSTWKMLCCAGATSRPSSHFAQSGKIQPQRAW